MTKNQALVSYKRVLTCMIAIRHSENKNVMQLKLSESEVKAAVQ